MCGQEQPDVRCEKLCQQPHKPRTNRRRAVQYCTKIRSGEEPRPARAPDSDPNYLGRPGMLLGATLGPKMAALPAEKHMANHRHVDGHAFLRYDIAPHAERW